jgi:hypothetical protein
MKVRRSLLPALVLLSILGHITVGQGRFWKHEMNLRGQFKLFIEYQRTGQWEKVAELRGDYYSKGRERIKYSSEEKRRMIKQLQARPMLSLDNTRTAFGTSTDNLSLPLNKQYRGVYAFVQFCDEPNCVHIETRVSAYTASGRWFFTPLERDFYEAPTKR